MVIVLRGAACTLMTMVLWSPFPGAMPPAINLKALGRVAQELAQRALVSYMRSVFLQPNRAVFNVASLPAADYAASLGLASAPRLRFLKRTQTAGSKCDGAPGAGGTGRPGANASRSAGDDDVDSGDESSGEDSDEDAGEETGDAAAEARRGSGAAAGISGAGGLRTGASGKHQVRRERSGSEDEPAGESGPSDGGGDGEKGSGDGSDDDGFLVVTRRNIHDVELAPEPAEDTALPGARSCHPSILGVGCHAMLCHAMLSCGKGLPAVIHCA